MPRTDHSSQIHDIREAAKMYQSVYQATSRETHRDVQIALDAAADLLEIHDATGLNLHEAPALLAFVQHYGGLEVENNRA